jgi:hypothetical protein
MNASLLAKKSTEEEQGPILDRSLRDVITQAKKNRSITEMSLAKMREKRKGTLLGDLVNSMQEENSMEKDTPAPPPPPKPFITLTKKPDLSTIVTR